MPSTELTKGAFSSNLDTGWPICCVLGIARTCGFRTTLIGTLRGRHGPQGRSSRAIAAYEKAMGLSQPYTDRIAAQAKGAVLRSSVVASYVHFLENTDQQKAAVLLLDRELRQAIDASDVRRQALDF